MAEVVGYVVLERNQASHQESIWSINLAYDMAEARELLEMAEDLKPIARGETFRIAALVPIEEE